MPSRNLVLPDVGIAAAPAGTYRPSAEKRPPGICALGSTMPSHEFVLPGTDQASRHECWRSFDVDPLIAEAVVWPETERYDRLRDFVESAANYGTYITTGGGPDYSIGRFQMKPSFVEELEKAWMRSGLARQYGLWFDTADNATARRIRITRMKKEEWQAVYLGVFLRMLYHSYGSFDRDGQRLQEGLEALPPEEQVRLAATAYNRGCVWTAPGCGDLEALRKASREKHFHYALVPTRHTRRYCYARLALKHYRRLAQK